MQIAKRKWEFILRAICGNIIFKDMSPILNSDIFVYNF